MSIFFLLIFQAHGLTILCDIQSYVQLLLYAYFKEIVCGSTVVGAVFDLCLLSKVISGVNRDLHLGRSQKGCQVGRVG